ncbi:MAG: IclR family transcriptional regulator [Acidimicrobiales bacterium]
MQSIERAFALLRALAVGPAGVTDLADRAELPKSTVARLLAALESEGAVEQVEAGGEYRLGHTLADLAGVAAPGHNLITAARPHLMELTNVTGETSGLAVLDGLEVYFLDHVESEEEVAVRGWTGQQVPPHLVPSGLVLLAGLPTATVDRYLRGDLEQATDESIVDPNVIRERIASIREVGHLWIEREFDPDLNSVAAPVWGEDGTVIAALHVHGPAYRFPDEKARNETGALVGETASLLAAQLSDGS